MSSVSRGSLLSALWVGLLGPGGCNNSFPTQTPPGGGPGGAVGARGGTNGGAGATGTGAAGVVGGGGSGPALDGGSGPPVDAGPLPHCSTVAPTGPVIADFNASTAQTFGVYGIDPVIGSAFILPVGALVDGDFSQGNWHLTGSVTRPVTFGLDWNCPGVIDGICTLDLSRYAGIQFTMNSDVGVPDSLQLTIGTVQDEAPSASLCGACNVPDGIESCTDPKAQLFPKTFGSLPATVRLTWTAFQSGDPYAYSDQARVSAITWTLPAAPDGGSYPVDFTLDDIRLIPIPH